MMVTRTRWAQQVTATSLSLIQRAAYQEYLDLQPDGNIQQTFSEWCKSQSEAHPQFLYWSMTLSLELLVMQFVKSLREGNFQLYVETLGKLAPWFLRLTERTTQDGYQSISET
jgi:hypothetical protein